MRVFVTGAASPLGRMLVQALVRRGDMVVGQVRRTSGVAAMRALGAEPVTTDLMRFQVLHDALSGCDVVYHLAQFFDFWANTEALYYRVNVDAARNVLAASLANRVGRVVLCSSSITAADGDVAWGEGSPWPQDGRVRTAYERSQIAAERMALAFRDRQLDVVLVNPGLVVGPNDTGWTGRLIAQCVSGRLRFLTDAPMGWTYVGDAAAALQMAAERGEGGQRYILNGETLPLRTYLGTVARIARQSPPMLLPRPIALARAFASTAFAAPLQRRPAVSVDEARFVTTGFRADGSRASTELGLDYTPMARYLPPLVDSYRRALQRFAA